MEPQSLAAALAAQMEHLDPASRAYRIRKQVLGADTSQRVLRDSVLARPELAAKLCQYPLSYAKPGHWSGFVPPELFNGERNDSPYREALAAIVAEAMEGGLDD